MREIADARRDLRPRRLQELQRLLRPRGRRRAAARLGAALDEPPAPPPAPPTAWAATSSASLLPDGADIEPVAAALREDGPGFTVDCSYGSVRVPREAADAPSALRLADQRMYAVKNARPSPPRRRRATCSSACSPSASPTCTTTSCDVGALAHEVGRRAGHPRGGAPRDRPRAPSCTTSARSRSPTSILHKPGPLDDDEWAS